MYGNAALTYFVLELWSEGFGSYHCFSPYTVREGAVAHEAMRAAAPGIGEGGWDRKERETWARTAQFVS